MPSQPSIDTQPLKPAVLVIGPVPPPVYGVATATRLMLQSPTLAREFRLVHLDTSDPDGLAGMGKLNLGNVALAVRHLWGLVVLLARERPSVTLLTVSQGKLALLRDYLFVMAARAFRSRVVGYLRGGGYDTLKDTQGSAAAWLLRRILKASSRTLVLGDSLIAMAHRACPEARVAAAPNGCPPAVKPPQVGTRREARPLVVYLGILARSKGVSDLVLAARLVLAQVPDLEFVFCGGWSSPEYEREVRQLVADEGLDKVITFADPVVGDDKEHLLAQAWVLAVPSHSEGQPWVILEAMSAGVPVVATDTGAVEETVGQGVAGFVVPVGDSAGLADKIVALVQDGDLWKQVSSSAARRYLECYTVERSHSALADQLLQVVRGE